MVCGQCAGEGCADGAVAVADVVVQGERLAVGQRGHGVGEDVGVEVAECDAGVAWLGVADGVARAIDARDEGGEVERGCGSWIAWDRVQEVAAPDQFFEGLHAEHGEDVAHFVCNVLKEVHDVFWCAGEAGA